MFSRKAYRLVLRLALLTVPVLILSSCCNVQEVIEVEPLRTFYISTNLPAGTEGTPGVEYSFTLSHNSTTLPLQYRWNFDDSTATIQSSEKKQNHTFTRVGMYGVSVQLIDTVRKIELARASKTVNVRGAVAQPEMVFVPLGSFEMGSSRVTSAAEQPVHTVILSRNLLVLKYELRQSDWSALMGTSPAQHIDPNLPVENVSWHDAVDYCNRLSVRHGYTPCYTISGDTVRCFFSANGYRLPTEAEWEYLARAGTSTDFYSGNAVQPYGDCLSIFTNEKVLDSVAWYCFNAGDSTHLCGQRAPNSFGLYDIIGNVAEWVWDNFDSNYYSLLPANDPTGPAYGTKKVVRGGSFNRGVIDCRAAARSLPEYPSMKRSSIGFRIVRSQ